MKCQCENILLLYVLPVSPSGICSSVLIPQTGSLNKVNGASETICYLVSEHRMTHIANKNVFFISRFD